MLGFFALVASLCLVTSQSEPRECQGNKPSCANNRRTISRYVRISNLRWYYSRDTRRCLAFNQGSCRDGQRNVFRTLSDCEGRCYGGKIMTSQASVTHRPSEWAQTVCGLFTDRPWVDDRQIGHELSLFCTDPLWLSRYRPSMSTGSLHPLHLHG